ncbi:protein kinase [Candidatus Woesearchaeota archaeon]|nr:protein kinase [Candidatus Woesearchaeota archaeon]
MRQQQIHEEEEFPLAGKTFAGIYHVLELIGGGGMCQVYKAKIDIHQLKAKEIIQGNLPLTALALSHSELELEPEHSGPITKPEQIEKIHERAEMLSSGLESIIQQQKTKRPDRSRDSSRIMHQKMLQTADADFRATGNIVALKVLRKSSRANEVLAKRFITEAHACRRFKDKNIIKSIDDGKNTITLDSGEQEEIHYFAMEYVDAYDFNQHNEKNPLPVPLATEILKGVSSGLNYLHSKGHIHRDVKDSNILIDKQSVLDFLAGKTNQLDVRLTDLGLAKVHQPIQKKSSSADQSIKWITKVTRDGQILGTPPYMSPEQIDSPSEVGSASDIWSLSATMYELLTGHIPFGDNCSESFAILSEIKSMNKPPKNIRFYNSKISQTIEDLIMMNFVRIRALTKKIKTVSDEGKEEWLDGDVITNDEGKVLYEENNRLTAQEIILAMRDYQNKEKRYFQTLDSLERQPVNENNEYGAETVKKRISTLEKAIFEEENYIRKSYLEKMLAYEKRLPIYRAPEPTPQPKKSGKIKKAVLYALGGLALIGSVFGGIQLNKHLERVGTYKEIRADIQETGARLIEEGKLEEAKKILEESQVETKRLPKDYRDTQEIIDTFENKLTYAQNKRAYTTAEQLVQDAEKSLKQRQLSESQTKTAEAEKQLNKITNGDFSEERAKLTERLNSLQEILSAKEGAISQYEFIEKEHARLQKTYETLLQDTEDGAPFPEPEKIKQILTDLERKKLALGDIRDDFIEKEKPVKEYTDLETKLNKLEQTTNSLGFKIAQKQIKQLQQKITQLPQEYTGENPDEAEKQTKNLLNSVETMLKTITEKDTNTLFPKIDQAKQEIKYYTNLKNKAKEENQTAKEILELETATRNPEQHIYVRNGITSETITKYKNKTEKYLQGKNMRTDTYVQIMLQDLKEKIPEHQEKIQTILEKAEPLFKTSWKIQQLESELDQNPENTEIQEKIQATKEKFTQTAQTIQQQFTELNTTITDYVQSGAKVPNPYDFIALGDNYFDRKDKERALNAYRSGLLLFKMGFPGDNETLKTTLKRVKQLRN